MKLARKLERQLNKVFILALGAGATTLILSAYFSTRDVQEKARNFILSHVRAISLAEINSYNVADIDREVRRVYDAWKSTQDIDIRVAIFIDDKLVGQAGQLQKFGFLSSKSTNTYVLPSQQKLRVDIELDLAAQLLTDLILLSMLVGFICLCFILLRKYLNRVISDVTGPIEARINWLSDVSGHLPNSIRNGFSFKEENCIDEILALDSSLSAFIEQILVLEERVSAASFDKGRLKMAEELAHNLKGTLGTLYLRINNSETLNAEEKIKLVSAVNDVSASAQRLLKARRFDESKKEEPKFSDFDLAKVLEKVVAQKKESVSNQNIRITFKDKSKIQAVIYGNESDIAATFSNLIDNGVDAISVAGEITVSLEEINGTAVVEVTDNGSGIPFDILPKLMVEGATFGKPCGNGLGLYHAKRTVEGMKGKIKISSAVGKGTAVTIEIPLAPKKNQIVEILPEQTVVILDDQQSVHDVWSIKFGNSSLKRADLYSVAEFDNWMNEHGPGELGSRIYLMDFDLQDKSQNGLMLISKYNLQLEAVLVTGMANDPEVQNTARERHVRLISKDDIAELELRIIKPSGEQIPWNTKEA